MPASNVELAESVVPALGLQRGEAEDLTVGGWGGREAAGLRLELSLAGEGKSLLAYHKPPSFLLGRSCCLEPAGA